ncbi:hypothetical protein HPB48_007208 [Haemaphysalis longicornis]|uniref:Chitin-binding type-2 domain-containing protein n=1 Tax=Haemaphysalis longicornis TaxID=44386 RepID=A0A9J6FTE7_HAELO|nr:hypothetical protein HPB48_007208 [Haemaphysalis longicornis]
MSKLEKLAGSSGSTEARPQEGPTLMANVAEGPRKVPRRGSPPAINPKTAMPVASSAKQKSAQEAMDAKEAPVSKAAVATPKAEEQTQLPQGDALTAILAALGRIEDRLNTLEVKHERLATRVADIKNSKASVESELLLPCRLTFSPVPIFVPFSQKHLEYTLLVFLSSSKPPRSTVNGFLLHAVWPGGRAQQQEFRCPSNNGYFPDPEQCDMYYECRRGVAKPKLCADGMAFHAGNPLYARCDAISNVDCSSRPYLQEAKSTKKCPRANGFFPHEDFPRVCSEFYNCNNGVASRTFCQKGLAFDPQVKGCAWAARVPGCEHEAVQASEVYLLLPG